MRFRKLRIAWSVVWGSAAVLLLAEWVRSYWTSDLYVYWVAILLIAALATTSWFEWSPRFSLRTLLIATTLIALVLGAIVYAVR
jgi:uncharacterized membrane protein YgaE (UPF0421/DUF939 family)